MTGGAPAPALILSGLSVRFPGFRLGPLDLDVAPGERLALVGANGAGKSTALRAAAGRLSGYEGSARALGHEVRADPVGARRRVGVLPERLLGFGWMRAADHLALLSRFYPGWDPAYADYLCRELDVPLGTRLRHLSRGNRVKLALVSAEAFRPRLLLLDEPTSGVDPVMRGRLLELVTSRFPGGGARALVFSTHILEDVEAVADRVAVLREGKLVATLSTEESRADSDPRPLSTRLRALLYHA